MEKEIIIRKASAADAEALLLIYAPYVEKTAITFEYDVPSVAEFAGRIENTLKKYPYLVAEMGGDPVGYAYASPFKTRAAYGWAVETSIYVKEGVHGLGIGRKLYDALEEALGRQNILNLNACIAAVETPDEHLDNSSIAFHEKLGYRMVGRFTKCGYKFGRWYDMVWMEKHIGAHTGDPAPVVPYPETDGV